MVRIPSTRLAMLQNCPKLGGGFRYFFHPKKKMVKLPTATKYMIFQMGSDRWIEKQPDQQSSGHWNMNP